MKKLIVLIVILINFSAFSQKDTLTHEPQAKAILDKLSTKTATFEAIRICFTYSSINKIDSVTDTYEGYLYIKGTDKYKLIIPNNEVFSNGLKVWSYLKKEAEMNVTWADPNDKSVLTPSNLLTIYEEGFKYSLKGEVDTEISQKINGELTDVQKTLYIIDLYPEKPNETPYSIIRLWIDKDNLKITNLRYFGKDQYDYLVDIVEFKTDTTIPDILFNFNEANYPADIEIIDVTE
jgi:outer membrane lipoprotein-sorting protein